MTRSEPSHDASSESDRAALARLHPTAFAHLVDRQYEPGEVHWLLGDRLRRLEQGEFDRLLILAPPRHGKSTMASIYFAAWFLGRHPDARVIGASYNDRLASHLGRQVRDLVASPLFHAVFPGVDLAADAAAADYWNISGHRGGYLAAGMGGTMTGYGADLFLIDDPIKNWEEAESPLQRDKTEDWLHSVALSRLEPGGRMVVTMTRWHQDDIAGRIMRAVAEGRDRWEVLELPALSTAGEPLWPERFTAEALERTRLAVDDGAWAAMYQQQPALARGKVFDRDWIRRFPVVPDPGRRAIARYIAVDTAFKDGEHNDYSVAVVAELMPDYRLYIRDVWRRRVPFTELTDELMHLAQQWDRDGKLREVVIEDAASGTSLYQTLRALSPELAAHLVPWRPQGSKVERARLASPWLRNGSVWLPDPSGDVPWLYDFERELLEFPGGIHDDQVDAFVHLVHYLVHYLAVGRDARVRAGVDLSEGVPLASA